MGFPGYCKVRASIRIQVTRSHAGLAQPPQGIGFDGKACLYLIKKGATLLQVMTNGERVGMASGQ